MTYLLIPYFMVSSFLLGLFIADNDYEIRNEEIIIMFLFSPVLYFAAKIYKYYQYFKNK